MRLCFFFFNDTATTEIYTLSLHDALPIYTARRRRRRASSRAPARPGSARTPRRAGAGCSPARAGRRRGRTCAAPARSEEHTSELQSRQYLVCRLLLEKKKQGITHTLISTT